VGELGSPTRGWLRWSWPAEPGLAAVGDVMTVTGPVAQSRLGVTLPHEHVFLDLSCLWHEPRDPSRAWLVDAPVAAPLQATLATDPYHSRDNLRLDDEAVALRELEYLVAAGGHTLVDMSTLTIGPYPEQLRRLALQLDLALVAGTGFYVQRAHPDWLRDAPWQQLAERMLHDLSDGFGESKIRAGVIGELGTSSPLHPDEIKVLRAAAAVQAQYPVGINVHLTLFEREGIEVVRLLEGFGADLSRVALSHLDETLDPGYHDLLAQTGVFLEFDTFGSECWFTESGTREPTDLERLAALRRLADQGYSGQLLLSQDVCTKMQWHQHGGRGYDHLLTAVVPRLLEVGFSEREVARMLEDNPARFLGGAPVPGANPARPAPPP